MCELSEALAVHTYPFTFPTQNILNQHIKYPVKHLASYENKGILIYVFILFLSIEATEK